MSIIYVLQGITVLIFTYFGNIFIEILYGSEYVNGTFLIFYGFLFAVIIDSFTYPLGLYIRNTNHENLFGIGKIISVFVFIGLELLLLFLMKDTMAIPIAYFVSKLALLAFYLFSIKKNNEKFDTIEVRKLLTWLLVILPSFISAILVNHYLDNIYYLILVSAIHIVLIIFVIPLIKIVNLKNLITDIKLRLSMKKMASDD